MFIFAMLLGTVFFGLGYCPPWPNELQFSFPTDSPESHFSPSPLVSRRSRRFAFTALIAIIAVCIAWFVNNTQVRVNGIQISAEDDQQFEIASVGERQKVEVDCLKDAESKNVLSDGTAEEIYNCYIDVDNGERKDVYQTYYTGRSGVAWRMEVQKNLAPGSGDKLEFYLIPQKTGLKSVTVKLNLKGYTLKDEKAELISDNKILSMGIFFYSDTIMMNMDIMTGWVRSQPLR